MTREPPSNYVDGNGNSAHDCMTQETVRAAFENSPASLKCYLAKHPNGQYRVAHTQNVFKDFCAGYEARAALSQPSVSVELSGVAEVLEEAKDEGIGFWHTCSGCYEGVDGQNVHGYPYSDIFKCTLGAGCRECGGIGAIWDTTDYEDMASHLSTAKPVEPSASVERITRLAQEFVESPNIHEAIADNGMTVADGFQEAFKQALTRINAVIGDKK